MEKNVFNLDYDVKWYVLRHKFCCDKSCLVYL